MEKNDPTNGNTPATQDATEEGRRQWVKPAVAMIEFSDAETGGSNFLNLDGGSSCAS